MTTYIVPSSTVQADGITIQGDGSSSSKLALISPIPASYIPQFFGDGADGSVTYAANATLSQDAYFSALTINAGVTLDTQGNIVRCSGTTANAGTLTDTLNGGAVGTPGAAGKSKNGFTGGGGGGVGGGNSGGTGVGGGIVILYTSSLNNTGTITAAGAAGANGQSPGYGGNGGGGGGVVKIVYHTLVALGTVTAAGGAGGTSSVGNAGSVTSGVGGTGVSASGGSLAGGTAGANTSPGGAGGNGSAGFGGSGGGGGGGSTNAGTSGGTGGNGGAGTVIQDSV